MWIEKKAPRRRIYLWQRPDWPQWRLDAAALAAPLGEGAPAQSLASATNAGSAPVKSVPVGATSENLTDVQDLVADGKLIRDARLERYLAAHKQYGGGSAVTVPGVVLRSSSTLAPDR